MMKQRNGTIDFMRFVFAIGIVLGHAEVIYDIVPNGWIGVEFFFLVTGWLMASKAARTDDKLSFSLVKRFIKRKILAFYPEAIIALLLGGMTYVLFFPQNIIMQVKFMCHVMLDALMLQIIIAHASLPGGVMWYLSAMIFGAAVIFPLLIKYPHKYLKYFFFISISLYIFIGAMYGTISRVWEPIYGQFGHIGLLRGIADMMLGCVAYKMSFFLRDMKQNVNLNASILGWIEIVSYMLVILLSMTHLLQSLWDYVALIFLFIAVVISFSEKSSIYGIFQHNWVRFLGGYSLNIYLVHITLSVIAISLKDYFQSQILLLLCFLICSFVYAEVDRIVSIFIREQI